MIICFIMLTCIICILWYSWEISKSTDKQLNTNVKNLVLQIIEVKLNFYLLKHV